MPAIRTVTRLADLDDVLANGGVVPDSALPPGATYDPNATYVLEFLGGGTAGQPDAGTNQCVHFGTFWRTGGFSLGGTFSWELWVAQTKTGFWVSDGYGGNHALLWGGSGDAVGGYACTGNVVGGDGIAHSFGGMYSAAQGEWVKRRVVWDGTNIFTLVNGVPDGRAPLSGRLTVGDGSGAGVLYFMGSDHLNAGGRAAILCGHDRGQAVPRMPVVNGYAVGYAPSRIMLPDPGGVPYDLYADMTRCTGRVVTDEAPVGCVSDASGVAMRHTGVLWNNGGNAAAGLSVGALPQRVIDTTCPYGQNIGSPLPAENIPAPGATTPGALAGDTWGRRNQTHAFQAAATLGSTEYGSRGPLAWRTGQSHGLAPAWPGGLWGILGGSAVYLDYGASAAWVDVGTAAQDVQASRGTGGYHSGECGLSFRVVDADNRWLVALIRNSAGGYYWEYGYYLAGAWTQVTLAAHPDPSGSWRVLRAHAVGTSVTVQYGDGASWTTLGSTTSSVLQTATGAGLSTPGEDVNTSGLARFNDWKCLPG